MSTITDDVHAAIENGARDRKALLDATGYEALQITNALSALRIAGKIEKRESGWHVTTEPAKKMRQSAPSLGHSIAQSAEVKPLATRRAEKATVPLTPAPPASPREPETDPEQTLNEVQVGSEPLTGKQPRASLTYAIDHRGKLILCFGEHAFELQPYQWTGLADFLHSLAPVFA